MAWFKERREIRIDGDVLRISLTRGLEAIADASFIDAVKPFLWCATQKHKTMYAVTNLPGGRVARKALYLHHLILPVPPGSGLVVDHINHNGLDNRIANLRLCTIKENVRNKRSLLTETSSRFKGVCWHVKSGKWMARSDGKYLGLFGSEELAAEAYRQYVTQNHGEFACFEKTYGITDKE